MFDIFGGHLLPFLKKARAQTGVIVQNRQPDEKESNESEDIDSIEICAQDLIKGIEAKDSKAVAEAIRSAFEILDSEPHEEGPHYDELNEKASENE